MARYAYRGMTREGKFLTGTVVAENEPQAIRSVETQGLVPLEVQEEKAKSVRKIFGKRLKKDEVILVARQLHTLLEAGVPLTTSLATLSKQTQNKVLKETLESVKDNIQTGRTFAESLAQHPDKFSELFVSMVKAGEETGLLNDMLDRLAALLEYEADNRARIRSATIYPMLVVGELCFAFAVIIKVVLPRFTGLFANSGVQLPLPTRMLISISNTTEANWPIFVAAIVLLAVAYKVSSRTPAGRLAIDKTRLRIPIVGPIVLKSLLSRFSRVLAALVTSGFPIVRSLEIVANTVGNAALVSEIQRARAQVVKGKGLAEPLEASRFFPPMVVKMIAIGEETGSLDKMLARTSSFYDREVDFSIKNLTTVLEPLLIVILGISVLFIALAVFLPMWNLMSAMKH
ncbi:MAG: type II secretion system F family protein [Candidatus Eisenbacteria bacterium]|nr:type II secretion system F family protein [Candidatus Eisenbacteria bacterium]